MDDEDAGVKEQEEKEEEVDDGCFPRRFVKPLASRRFETLALYYGSR